jgi:hypothetical protein
MIGVGVGITGGGSRWSPEALAPPLWLRPDVGNITLASGDLAGIASKVGTRTFSQSTAGARPLYSANGAPGGNPYMELGGTRWLQGDGGVSPWAFLHTGALVLWAVVYKVGATVDITAALATQATAAHKGSLFTLDNTGSLYRTGQAVYAGTGVTTPIAYATSSNNAAPSNTWRCVEWRLNPATGVVVRSNGADVHTIAGAYTAPTGNPTNAAQIGRAPGYTFGAPIRIAELLAVSAVPDTATLDFVRGYFRARYPGVTA